MREFEFIGSPGTRGPRTQNRQAPDERRMRSSCARFRSWRKSSSLCGASTPTTPGVPGCARTSPRTSSTSACLASRSTFAMPRCATRLMTLTTMDPPVVAFVSVWVQQSYGTQLQAAKALLQQECDDVAAYLVTESVPLPPPPTVAGQRTAGLANVALLRRPADLDEDDLAVALAHRPHTGRDRNPVDVRLHTERGGTRA